MAHQYPLVPRYRDLTIAGGAEALDRLTDQIGQLLQPPWERAIDTEQSPQLSSDNFRVFRRDASGGQPRVQLFLVPLHGDAYVSNIVPDGEDLTMDTYNEVLVEFYERLVLPTVAKLGLRAELSGPIIDLQRELDSATHDALAAFSIAANKATGSGHPSDRRRWLDFLVLLHRSGYELTPDVLQDWLMADGWSEEVAHRLILEFEFAQGLLKHADSM
jgi:hypothetical protein